MYTVPNIITLARIALVPVFILIFFLPFHWSYIWAAAIFTFAGVTDWVDGYLARRLNQASKLGAFLDPVADKLMVSAALILLVEMHASAWLAIPAIVIIGREIAISALREWMAECGKRTQVAVSYIGKVKTVIQMIAIAILLGVDPAFLADEQGMVWALSFWLGFLLLYVAMALTLWSGAIYLKAAWPNLIEVENKG